MTQRNRARSKRRPAATPRSDVAPRPELGRLSKSEAMLLVRVVCVGRALAPRKLRAAMGVIAKGYAEEGDASFIQPPIPPDEMMLVPTPLGTRRILGGR